MSHQLNKLTARTAATATRPGLYAGGGGLHLRVGRGGAKSWCLRYMLNGKAHEMGLGGLSKVGLADARKRVAAQRLLLVDKIDPLQRREAENSTKKIEVARCMTFDQCAKAYIEAYKAGWRNTKIYRGQVPAWRMPDRSRGRPRGFGQAAELVMDLATGRIKGRTAPADGGRNPAAVALGRIGGLKGLRRGGRNTKNNAGRDSRPSRQGPAEFR
ncbi:MAG TPA: Arm DNA-binding domain-containing protein [Candidatus Binatia bacterium]